MSSDVMEEQKWGQMKQACGHARIVDDVRRGIVRSKKQGDVLGRLDERRACVEDLL